jgi:hypothetical protein
MKDIYDITFENNNLICHVIKFDDYKRAYHSHLEKYFIYNITNEDILSIIERLYVDIQEEFMEELRLINLWSQEIELFLKL